MEERIIVAYVLWLFGFTGSHRFFLGRPVSGTIYFCTFGLFGIGWLLDLLLIPSMVRSTERHCPDTPYSPTLTWILLTFLGVFGIHRFYVGRVMSGILYFLTGGFCFLGVLYDFWHFNELLEKSSQ